MTPGKEVCEDTLKVLKHVEHFNTLKSRSTKGSRSNAFIDKIQNTNVKKPQ